MTSSVPNMSDLAIIRTKREHPVDAFFPGAPAPRGRVRCPSGVFLTEKETEIGWYIWTGCSNSVIKDKLGIATGTLSAHTTHIYAKTGLNRAQIAVLWERLIRKGYV